MYIYCRAQENKQFITSALIEGFTIYDRILHILISLGLLCSIEQSFAHYMVALALLSEQDNLVRFLIIERG
jgi:hypothetical protein